VWRAALVALFVIGWHAGGTAAVAVSGTFGGQIESTPSQLIELNQLLFGLALHGEGWYTSVRAMVVGGDLALLGFSDDRRLGPISLSSSLMFDPSQSAFSYFSNLARLQLQGLGLSNYVYYPAQKTQGYDQIVLDGFAEEIRWRAAARLGLCDLDFQSATLNADWTWIPCGLALEASLSFSCQVGFDRFRVAMTYPEVPRLSLGPMATDFVLEIDLQTGVKSVSPGLRARLARASACVTPLYALDVGAAPLTLDSITLYGVKLQAALEDIAEFYAATSYVSAKNAELTGNADYFELYRLRLSPSSCCGGDSLLEVAFYFDDTSPGLFDLGMVAASVEFSISSKGRLRFGMEYPVSGDWTLRLGWDCQL